MAKDNIVDFNALGKGASKGKAPGEEQQMFGHIIDMLENTPPSALMDKVSGLLCAKLAHLFAYMEIAQKVSEILTKNGLDPELFKPDLDSFNEFLLMDWNVKRAFQDPDDPSVVDPHVLWNGPRFEWLSSKGVRTCAATTVLTDAGDMNSVCIDVLRIGPYDQTWQMRRNGAWDPAGPPRDIFEYLEAMRDDDDDDGLFEDFDWDEDSVWYLDLDYQTLNRLDEAGIETIDQLTAMTEKELLKISGIGRKSVQKIVDALAQEGLSLKS